MNLPLLSLVVFFIGLILWMLSSVGAKLNEVGRILMLAGAMGFVFEGHHSIAIR